MFGRPVRSPYAYFYPRPPRGGRRTAFSTNSSSRLFLSTPSARRATIASSCKLLPYFIISIHALREEGDPALKAAMPAAQKFLSTPSARRATVGEVPFTYLVLEFLSTPSARRATGAIHGGETFQWNFYPRPPRGGRRNAVNSVINFFKISIHALREEGDGLRKSSDTP